MYAYIEGCDAYLDKWADILLSLYHTFTIQPQSGNCENTN